MIEALTGAGAVLSAAHRSRDGAMHGHTWEIVCWWAGVPCAVQKQRELTDYLSRFDHTVLDDAVAWGEAMGRMILTDLGCVRVDINRPLERIYAVVLDNQEAKQCDTTR